MHLPTESHVLHLDACTRHYQLSAQGAEISLAPTITGQISARREYQDALSLLGVSCMYAGVQIWAYWRIWQTVFAHRYGDQYPPPAG